MVLFSFTDESIYSAAAAVEATVSTTLVGVYEITNSSEELIGIVVFVNVPVMLVALRTVKFCTDRGDEGYKQRSGQRSIQRGSARDLELAVLRGHRRPADPSAQLAVGSFGIRSGHFYLRRFPGVAHTQQGPNFNSAHFEITGNETAPR